MYTTCFERTSLINSMELVYSKAYVCLDVVIIQLIYELKGL